LFGLCALALRGFFSRDPFTVLEKGGDKTGIYQVIEAGFKGHGTSVVAAANE
jgi:hypothetical protein